MQHPLYAVIHFLFLDELATVGLCDSLTYRRAKTGIPGELGLLLGSEMHLDGFSVCEGPIRGNAVSLYSVRSR